MTVHTPITPANTNRFVTPIVDEIKTPAVDEKAIRRLAVTGGAEAAQAYAGSVADRANGGLRAKLEAQKANAMVISERLSQQIADFEGQAKARSGVLWRRLRNSDPDVQMTKMERVQCVFYIGLTLVALTFATLALALMMMELGTIEKVTDSLWTALLYAFPVVLASSGFASMATLHDDDKVIEQRAMRALKWGAAVFVAWIAMTAIVFVGENGGYNPQDLLSLSNDPFDDTEAAFPFVDQAYVLLRSVFPSGVTSATLLVVHIIAEVLIAAGLTARVTLMGRKTREITAYHCPRAVLAQEKVTELELKKSAQDSMIAGYDDQIAEIDAVRKQYIEDVVLMTTSEERASRAMVLAAKAEAERNYLRAAL